MTQRIRVGIVGYGNLGRGVEASLALNPDLELVGVFTRRDPATLTPARPETRVFGIDALDGLEDQIDVLILCGGSKDDLPIHGPELAARFSTVDSFDTHARVPEYFEAMNAAASGERVAIISVGWDPGLFSINRLYGEAILPEGDTHTFWGRGLSQGHSDAIRRVPGVAAGVQYTIPSEDAIARVRSGERPALSTRDKHARECFIVLEEGANEDEIRETIVSMPHYFDEYNTTVNVITAEEFAREHSAMPHGGFVIRSGESSPGTAQVIEYQLTLASNPEFTASVLVAYARAAARLGARGQFGAHSVLDIAPALLSPETPEALRARLL
ncbi:diaminopimelate dehydrogenase [Mycetocola tolaasinivorans]|uniref:Meso-diaminopimelate D-dehydrogenase n=1 Tax=Mycetocola tolaasinivorans TaxID=76635 RepID=A0A3L7A926_9MICO|nr:diaminopimelate dehydrogenase [Mycetocola tolaasinivorans]RLP76839.1 diaminopimelate dehydrogenase [Mycetocola tolaasinivorans]